MFQQVALELGHFFPYEQWLCACVGVACVGVHARVVCVGVPVQVWRAQVCLRGWGMHRCACVGVACVGVHAWVWHVCLQA